MSATTTKRRRRSYSQSGLYGGQRAAPAIVARASDPDVRDDDLTDLERGCRYLRDELVDALGGQDEVTPQQRILIDVVVSKALVVGTVQRYVAYELGGAVIDRRAQRPKRLCFDLAKLENGLVSAVAALGLERKAPTLSEYLARLSGDRDDRSRALAAGAEQDDADPVASAADDSSEGSEEAS